MKPNDKISKQISGVSYTKQLTSSLRFLNFVFLNLNFRLRKKS